MALCAHFQTVPLGFAPAHLPPDKKHSRGNGTSPMSHPSQRGMAGGPSTAIGTSPITEPEEPVTRKWRSHEPRTGGVTLTSEMALFSLSSIMTTGTILPSVPG